MKKLVAFAFLLLWNMSYAGTPLFPLKQDIILNVLIKGPSGCLQQGKFSFPRIPFFTDNFKISQRFNLKDLNEKVTGHYQADIEVTELSKDRSRFKVVMLIVDIDKDPKDLHYIQGAAINFMSGGSFFANITRFQNADPKLGWNEVLIGDQAFFDSGKKPNT